ncbi:MAG: hypothetical protein L6R48_08410 [Planctomycetes bacterium]|nr:hypothetical protein [Planctomycetota bacterium]
MRAVHSIHGASSAASRRLNSPWRDGSACLGQVGAQQQVAPGVGVRLGGGGATFQRDGALAPGGQAGGIHRRRQLGVQGCRLGRQAGIAGGGRPAVLAHPGQRLAGVGCLAADRAQAGAQPGEFARRRPGRQQGAIGAEQLDIHDPAQLADADLDPARAGGLGQAVRHPLADADASGAGGGLGQAAPFRAIVAGQHLVGG